MNIYQFTDNTNYLWRCHSWLECHIVNRLLYMNHKFGWSFAFHPHGESGIDLEIWINNTQRVLIELKGFRGSVGRKEECRVLERMRKLKFRHNCPMLIVYFETWQEHPNLGHLVIEQFKDGRFEDRTIEWWGVLRDLFDIRAINVERWNVNQNTVIYDDQQLTLVED